jgi:hypothetical protein
MPIGAGFVVAYLQKWGFSPALKFLTRAIEGVVDDSKNAAYPTSYWQVSSLMLQPHATAACYMPHAIASDYSLMLQLHATASVLVSAASCYSLMLQYVATYLCTQQASWQLEAPRS